MVNNARMITVVEKLLVTNALAKAVHAIGPEAVDVYLFLSDQFSHGPVTQNRVFQFVYQNYIPAV